MLRTFTFSMYPNGRRRGPAYYRRQLRRKNRATKSNDTHSTQSAENEVEVNTDDRTQASELKSTIQKDDSRLEISDVSKESTSIGAEEVHKKEDSEPSHDNQPSSCTTLFSTKTCESSFPIADDLEFGDKVSQILKTLSNEMSKDVPVTSSKQKQPMAETEDQLMIEDKCEVDNLECPLSEHTRDEFYAIMNSRLGLNIQPS